MTKLKKKELNCITKRQRRRLLKAEIDKIKRNLTTEKKVVVVCVNKLLQSQTVQSEHNHVIDGHTSLQNQVIRDIKLKNEVATIHEGINCVLNYSAIDGRVQLENIRDNEPI